MSTTTLRLTTSLYMLVTEREQAVDHNELEDSRYEILGPRRIHTAEDFRLKFNNPEASSH